MKRSTRRNWLLPLITLACGLIILVVDTRPQQNLRLQLFDQYQRWRPREYADVPVRIVDIDEESLQHLGQWPWPRTRLAELFDKLTAQGAAVIAFDVILAEPDRTSPRAAAALWRVAPPLRAEIEALPDHDWSLAQSLAKGDAVLGFAVDNGRRDGSADSPPPPPRARFIQSGEPATAWLPAFDRAVAALPELEGAAKGSGALTFLPDGDGIVRRIPLVLQVAGTTMNALVTEALRVAQDTPNVILKSAGQGNGLAEIKVGGIAIPTTPRGEMWLHYSPAGPGRYVPAWRILENQAEPSRIEGHIVLIGSSAQGLMDLRFNPFGSMPGVEAHAQALEQILGGQFLQRPGWARGVEAMALMAACLAVGLIALNTRALVAALSCLVLLAVLFGGSWSLFVEQGWLIDAATPAIATLLTFVLCSLAHHRRSEREQRWIKNAFARYVSPNRVEHLVANPGNMELGGERRTCSFVFTDLAGFTSLMEKMAPEDAVGLLNTYLDELIAIAFRHDGTLDRIIGDAVAIMFSAPIAQADHAERALACALEMDEFANRYAQKLQDKGVPFGLTRIGVHSGEVIVGNFGGSSIFDYRALGDPVNTAARLESANRYLGTRVCISEAILAACLNIRARPVGHLVLKGKTQPLAVFEPCGNTQDSTHAPLAAYQAAFDALRSQTPAAADMFRELAASWPDDPLVALHHRRLQAGEQGDLIVMSEK